MKIMIRLKNKKYREKIRILKVKLASEKKSSFKDSVGSNDEKETKYIEFLQSKVNFK